MSSLGDRVAELRRRAAQIRLQIVALAERRAQHAFDAAAGDQSALSTISEIDADSAVLERERQTVSSALEVGERKQREEAAQAERAQQRECAIEARQHADGIAALNVEIDHAMTQLLQMFQRRATLIAGLANTGVVDSLFVARFAGKPGPTRAACYAGLHRFFALETVSPQGLRPLADSNPLLASIGAQPSQPCAKLEQA